MPKRHAQKKIKSLPYSCKICYSFKETIKNYEKHHQSTLKKSRHDIGHDDVKRHLIMLEI